MLDIHSRRGTPGVGQRFGAFQNHRLAPVVFRHRDLSFGKPGDNAVQYLLIQSQGKCERFGGALTSDVIFRRSKPADGERQIKFHEQ